MDSLLVALPGLGCAAMMVGMMWFMSRGMKQTGQAQDVSPPDGHAPGATPEAREQETQLTELRAEIERLRAEVRDREPSPDDDRDRDLTP